MPTAPAAPLPLTGERTLPDLPVENYWFRRHEAAYLALAPFVRGSLLVEAGCGEGYGADLLARTAQRILALDYDAASVAHVRARYPAHDVVRADLQRLPVAAGSVEVVANLQVIEHLHNQAGFLRECARVLRPAGTPRSTRSTPVSSRPPSWRPCWRRGSPSRECSGCGTAASSAAASSRVWNGL